ncbi:MAG: hypothetical protein CVU05_02455 [Bacteroidetes bacterium HGW-Bacteroidetes-21]|jgi:ELWxxDGT repeat protein|nr:MAG: hypothetical protein CVU05_02455 [Bacteroidetes bacterium HGW-Bacteroidetes-21]
MKKVVFFIGMLLLVFSVKAQNIEMVKDINPSGSSSPSWMKVASYNSGLQFVSKLFFNADNGVNGKELWVTDGTSAGTTMIKDINPSGNSSPYRFFSVGIGLSQRVIFLANDGTNGTELWTTNGTAGGTNMVKNIYTGALQNVEITCLFSNLFKVYFNADDGVNGREIWVTDGTSAGTNMIKDINPGSSSSTPSNFILYNNKLYFVADDGTSGTELWCTDGTEAGTTFVKDINPGSGSAFNSSTISSFYGEVYNNKLYFTANNGTSGTELWVTDGTTSGTTMIKNINASGDSNPQNYTEFNGKLYFAATDDIYGRQLWCTDGTTAGTQRITNWFVANYPIYNLTVFNDQLYFYAADSTHNLEPWISDGTTTGTSMIKDINLSGPSLPYAMPFTEYNGYLYFAPYTTNGYELYRTDGTETGTTLLAPSIAPNTSPLDNSTAVVFNGSLYFLANFDSNGAELWKLTDSTTNVVFEQMSNTNLYPNPATDILHVTLKEQDNVLIYNMIGINVMSFESHENEPVDISHLPAGSYVLVSAKNNYRKSFIKL